MLKARYRMCMLCTLIYVIAEHTEGECVLFLNPRTCRKDLKRVE